VSAVLRLHTQISSARMVLSSKPSSTTAVDWQTDAQNNFEPYVVSKFITYQLDHLYLKLLENCCLIHYHTEISVIHFLHLIIPTSHIHTIARINCISFKLPLNQPSWTMAALNRQLRLNGSTGYPLTVTNSQWIINIMSSQRNLA